MEHQLLAPAKRHEIIARQRSRDGIFNSLILISPNDESKDFPTCDDFFGGRRCAVILDHIGRSDLTETRVRHADDLCHANRRVPLQDIFEVRWCNIFTTDAKAIFQPPDEA